ncbi:outer membrane beta-barrel protein, partial [Helicobacter cetorum]|uniref:outer membrane beta-barrel protein n=1 Tax=Helicobacter cetorum TaxID=138563 RepID=UPI000CF1BFE8
PPINRDFIKIPHFNLSRILKLSALAFSVSCAMDSAQLQELSNQKIQKEQKKAFLDTDKKKIEQVSSKQSKQNAMADKKAFFAGVGFSIASGQAGLFEQNWFYPSSSANGSQAIVYGFDLNMGYQYVGKKHPHLGVRAGFVYSFEAGDYQKSIYFHDKYCQKPKVCEVAIPEKVSMSTYSFFIDFLNDFYQSKKFFIGWFLGAGFGGESASMSIRPRFHPKIFVDIITFQGFGTLGLRMGNKHHTLEVSGSVHGGKCLARDLHLDSCFNSYFDSLHGVFGLWPLYVTMNANYIYRF